MKQVPHEQDTALLHERASEAFAHSVERLDAPTRAALNRARQAALEEVRRPRHPLLRRGWLPAGALAAAAVVAILVGRPGAVPDPSDTAMANAMATLPAAAIEDLELAADDSLEMLEEIEFYAWLSNEAEASGDGESG